MNYALWFILFLLGSSLASLPSPIYVTVVGDSPSLELAGKDATRYLRLLRCGHGPASSNCAILTSSPPAGSPTLLITTLGSLTHTQRALLIQEHSIESLSGDAHLVSAPLNDGGALTTVCTGATPRAAMYAVYTLLESLGARFYLTGDVLPLPNASLSFPLTPILSQPQFAERGLQPFHDFPMGPDWWTLDFYRFTATQMAKMKLNKWGFHTYPFLSAGPEPLAWVGTEGQFDPATGEILPQGGGAYTSSWFLTQNFPRGNVPGSVSRATSNYCCGAATAFPRDCFGSPAQADECWPSTPEASAAVLNDAAALLQGAFEWGATTGGISACLGSEMPLTHPPSSNATTAELYTGMFARAAASIPSADCFWLWTTEAVEDHSNGKGYPQSNPLWGALTEEINTALAARDAVAPHLAVGSNGWCLGPGDNSSYFDAVITDPRFSLSSIDGSLGWCDVDPGFANVQRHPSNVIAWMEDDLGLAGGELWVARTLAHASDAALYNASGLLGILWRTFETSPQVAALATAGWSSTSAAPPTPTGVYQDFCMSNFGADTVAVCTDLFLSLDGATPGAPTFEAGRSKFPRGGQLCCGGPVSPQGGEGPVSVLDTSAWEAWGASVSSGSGGAAAAARAGQWVGLILYHASLAQACLAGQALEAAAAKVVDEASAREIGFPALAAMSWAWEAMITALLAYTTTPGELGMLSAHEGGNWPSNFYAAAGNILPYLTGQCAGVAQSPCYWDNYTQPSGRVLPHLVTMNSPHNSREWCAGACAQEGYPWAGVEFGVACFCGSTLPDPSQAIPNATACAAMPCAGAPGEGCGGADIISVLPSACPPASGLPPGLLPPKTYQGQPRMWPSAPRSTIGVKEGGVTVEVVVLAAQQPQTVTAVWWLVPSSGGGGGGAGGNTSTPLLSTAGGSRGIWGATLPIPSDSTDVLEYVVVAQWGGGGMQLVEPVEGAQSVVFLDGGNE